MLPTGPASRHDAECVRSGTVTVASVLVTTLWEGSVKSSAPLAVRIAALQNIRSRPPPASRPLTSRSHLSADIASHLSCPDMGR
jgi:hypothetical protein